MATLTPLPLPQSFEDFCALFLLFIAYSTLGWCGEMIYCSVPKGRLCEKRGFLNGFLCPIYGRVCLLNSTCFGLACVVLCHVVHPWLWAHILGLGSAVIVPLASFISGIYLTDTVLSVRSAIQLSAQMGKLRELQSEIRDHIAEKREESAERRAERREEARERARALRDGADIFERRLLHSHPQLKAAREDLLAGIRARLSENETELEQLRSVYSPRRDKK